MKIKISELGSIKKAELRLKDLTVICGPNNTGKTYLSYTVYSVLKNIVETLGPDFLDKYHDDILKNKRAKIPYSECEKSISDAMVSVGSKFANNIHRYFSVSSRYFESTNMQVSISMDDVFDKAFDSSVEVNGDEIIAITKKKEEDFFYIQLNIENDDFPDFVIFELITNAITKFFMANFVSKVNIQTAERCGIALFCDDIDFDRISLIKHLEKKDANKNELIKSLIAQDDIHYAQPIKDNLNWYKQVRKDSKQESELSNIADYISKNILNGSLLFNDEGAIKYKPNSKIDIPMYLSSSAIKSLAGILLFVRHQAQIGSYLIIDEPELNLHPANQVKVARSIALLVNSGVKVLVTTHSDYFVKEINNLIMLSSPFEGKEEFISKNGYTEEMVLNTAQVAEYYIPQDGIVQEIEADKFGFDVQTFDEVIFNQDNIAQELFSNIEE